MFFCVVVIVMKGFKRWYEAPLIVEPSYRGRIDLEAQTSKHADNVEETEGSQSMHGK